MVVDKFGVPHSLTRYINGHKAKDIKKRLVPLTPEDLPTVDQAKEIIRRRQQAQDEGEGEGERRKQEAALRRRKAVDALTAKHEKMRAALRTNEQEMLTRQQAERLALHAAQKSEASSVLFRVRCAVSDLLGKTPGLRSALSHIQKLTHLDPKERHALESEALNHRHARERKDVERGKRFLSRIESRERRALAMALRRQVRQDTKADKSAEALGKAGTKSDQELYGAAKDQGLWKSHDFEENDLGAEFNDAAKYVEGVDHDGDDDDDRTLNRSQRPEDRAQSHRRGRGHRRGRRYSYRQDE